MTQPRRPATAALHLTDPPLHSSPFATSDSQQPWSPHNRTVAVVDMKGLSDHHTVLLRMGRNSLTDILNHPLTRTA
ncbi:hypothetical protein [Streptomyces sp. NPDC007000]|uniref:hypothetical protein n=1 Tax=Streptomyces sp. NPDC007000 TaxID=3155357 RepID=UPI0033D67F5F